MYRAGDTIGPYTLIRTLGKGGFGEVWLGEKHSSLLTTQAALKLPLLADTDIAVIQQEAQVWLQASGHPNIVPVLEAEVYGGQVVIASEYISGGTLADWAAAHGGRAPSIEAAVTVMSGILSGLDHLHQLGLVHRDIKPENVMLQAGVSRLTDFGVTRFLKPGNATGSICGTPRYLAPETFQAKYSAASDLWAAGIILFELLSGISAFPQNDLMALILAIQGQHAAPLPASVPAPICEIVSRLLKKAPEDRFATACDAREALHSAAAPGISLMLSRKAMNLSLRDVPSELTAFVGREKEIEEWLSSLQSSAHRLFTITGFPGVGKTRVAQRLGELCHGAFADGVCWCNIEQARTVDETILAIRERLQIAFQPALDVREQLFQYLQEKKLLLILDNVEQVAGAQTFLRDLLAAAPSIKCLVTSRRPLAVRGEVLLELSPMSVEEGVKLFTERATECRPEFTLGPENRTDVGELSRRLEGIPLAIELAAARIVGLAPRQILHRLNQRFRLLRSRDPDVSPRQRALEGAIDWSYALLAEEDRGLFAQLAVFAGGFTLADVEAICEAPDVFESVMALRQHSFFRVETDAATQETRFVMLDSLREYAAEKLAERQDGGVPVRERHASYFLKYARDRIQRLRTPEEAEALHALEFHANNVRSAREWARDAGRTQLHAELALVEGVALYRRGFLHNAAEILQEGLAALQAAPEKLPDVRARLLHERAGLHYDFREYDAARHLAESSLLLFRSANDRAGQARSANLIGQIAMDLHQLTEAETRFSASVELYTECNDASGIAIVRNNQGILKSREYLESGVDPAERQKEAAAYLGEALEIRRRLTDHRGLAETLNNLGILAFEVKDFDTAANYYVEALSHFRELGHLAGVVISLANLGEAVGLRGDQDRAVRLLLASDHLAAEIRSPHIDAIAEMLRTVERVASLSPDDVARWRSEQDLLSLDQCIEWGLAPPPRLHFSFE